MIYDYHRILLTTSMAQSNIMSIVILALFTLSILPITFAQETGNQAELIRLRDRAEEAMSMGDSHGASLTAGKAALMAALLARQETGTARETYYHSLEAMLRAQESVYRALALFQQSGEQIPASSGVCRSMSLASTHREKAQHALPTPIPDDPLFQDLPMDLQEWKETIQELESDLGCVDGSSNS